MALLLVWLFLFIFRVKDPTIRTAFFFIPLIKPFIMIIEKIDLSHLYFQNSKWTLGIRFPDPTNIINLAESTEKGPVLNESQDDHIILIIIIAVILIFLIIRWINLAMFYRNLAL